MILCSRLVAVSLLAPCLSVGLFAQGAQTSAAQNKAPVVSPVKPNVEEAWSELQIFAEAKNVDQRVQTMTALGLLGGHQRALNLLRKGFDDPEVDVRIAAVVAAGASKDKNLTTDLRSLLDDKDPEVAYAAALNLWKMGDHSGEDILLDVLRGDRKTDKGLMKEGMHHANRELHSPADLAKMGALQASLIFLPPVGYGLGAYRYMHSSGPDPRVESLEMLTQEHNNLVRDTLIELADDKDTALRIAIAEKLSGYRGQTVVDALAKLFDDSKEVVRLTAYAAYIRVLEPARTASIVPAKTTTP